MRSIDSRTANFKVNGTKPHIAVAIKMAFSLFERKSNTFTISDYIIKIEKNNGHVVGQGAYGIVYKAVDRNNETVAAKTINVKIHNRILTQDFITLTKLNHENIVRIMDFHQQEETFWMFMELCRYGDLNDFFHNRFLYFNHKVEIMRGIANGIGYLHAENIIHRDIKPGNILIGSTLPIVPKLTDFDLSKSLDPDYETSVMSSNVGTLAFKAPEFFNRIDGKLRYHRNVDIYAAGLTFLAMIQAKEGCKKLVPQIETPQDDSELHVQSIGQLIAERIKYKVKNLNIVVNDEKKAKAMSIEMNEARKLIQKMTSVDPKDRLTADQVMDLLIQVNASLVDDCTITYVFHQPKKTQLSYFVHFLDNKTVFYQYHPLYLHPT